MPARPPISAKLSRDSMLHIYVDGQDSGMGIEYDHDEEALVIHPGGSARWRLEPWIQ